MRGAVGGIVSRDDDLPGQKVLHTEVPLINFGAASDAGVEVAAVAESPIRQLPVSPTLGRGEASRKRIAQGGGLGHVVVGGEIQGSILRERSTGVLKVSGNVHAVKDSGAAA